MGRNSYTDEDASSKTLDTPTTFSNVFLGLFCFRASARGVVVKQTSSLYVFTVRCTCIAQNTHTFRTIRQINLRQTQRSEAACLN